MMTNKQHDDAWLDVMERQVPNGVGYIKQLTQQMIYQNYLHGLEMLKDTIGMEGSTYTKEDYLVDLRTVLKKIGFNGEFVSKEIINEDEES